MPVAAKDIIDITGRTHWQSFMWLTTIGVETTNSKCWPDVVSSDKKSMLLEQKVAAMQDVKDNHEEAAKVAPQTLRLCQMVREEPCMLGAHIAGRYRQSDMGFGAGVHGVGCRHAGSPASM